MNATITLREYLEKGKCFVIPNYQRGYVWGKTKKGDDREDAVTYMMDSLISGFNNDKAEVFIQGITVSEKKNEIILIDGQQRTTFFYLLLKHLAYSGRFHIRYDIREESDNFLKSDMLTKDIAENSHEDYQDIYFFKKSLRTINKKLSGEEDKNSFREYVLDCVKFLYIDIPENKATKVFSMMNGNKAEMKAEELIKAELLRLASLNEATRSNGEEDYHAIEWDHNMLRSRYAREWDKWLQWWNRPDVKAFYEVDHVMGLLISTYQLSGKSSQLSFENFRNNFLKEQQASKAKESFDKLRRLQKRFEDAFYNPQIYNRVGAIMRIGDKDNFIKWYFLEQSPSLDKLNEYYKLSFLGLTHTEILKSNEEVIKEKFDECYEKLESNNVYNDSPEEVFRLLLRLNIDEDNQQEDGRGRKFDFSIWNRARSTEHIYPKSKVWHRETVADGTQVIKNGKGDILSYSDIDDSYIERDTEASEHSIGNLVLLYKDKNSSFSNRSFEEKKSLFFKKDKKAKAIFKSRHLLHTIYKFANSNWKGADIAKNKASTLKEFRSYYGQKQD